MVVVDDRGRGRLSMPPLAQALLSPLYPFPRSLHQGLEWVVIEWVQKGRNR